jgi:hypothetical protein
MLLFGLVSEHGRRPNQFFSWGVLCPLCLDQCFPNQWPPPRAKAEGVSGRAWDNEKIISFWLFYFVAVLFISSLSTIRMVNVNNKWSDFISTVGIIYNELESIVQNFNFNVLNFLHEIWYRAFQPTYSNTSSRFQV